MRAHWARSDVRGKSKKSPKPKRGTQHPKKKNELRSVRPLTVRVLVAVGEEIGLGWIEISLSRGSSCFHTRPAAAALHGGRSLMPVLHLTGAIQHIIISRRPISRHQSCISGPRHFLLLRRSLSLTLPSDFAYRDQGQKHDEDRRHFRKPTLQS